MSDELINMAQNLLQKYFTNISGLQDAVAIALNRFYLQGHSTCIGICCQHVTKQVSKQLLWAIRLSA